MMEIPGLLSIYGNDSKMTMLLQGGQNRFILQK